MDASAVVIRSEFFELPVKIDRIPEERLVQIFAPDGSDQSLDERVRHRGARHGFDLLELEDSQVREPSVKAEQRIVIRTYPRRRRVAGNGLIVE